MPIIMIATGLAMVADWVSRRPGTGEKAERSADQWLEWIAKPAATVGLLILAAALDAVDGGQQRLTVLGLALCLAGDVFLMLPVERFGLGLVSFLVGHLAFVAGFLNRAQPAPPWSIVIAAVLVVLCLAVGSRRLVPAVRRRHPDLLGPILVYIAVIAAMAVAAWWGGSWPAPLGAAVFALSDLTLADNKFVQPRAWAPVAVMVTYHLALSLIVVSLAF
jgi:uncharacterized membrane protein YhhN